MESLVLISFGIGYTSIRNTTSCGGLMGRRPGLPFGEVNQGGGVFFYIHNVVEVLFPVGGVTNQQLNIIPLLSRLSMKSRGTISVPPPSHFVR